MKNYKAVSILLVMGIWFNGCNNVLSLKYIETSIAQLEFIDIYFTSTATITPLPTGTATPSKTPDPHQVLEPIEIQNMKLESMPESFDFSGFFFQREVNENGEINWVSKDTTLVGLWYQPYPDKPIDFYFRSNMGQISFYITPASNIWLDFSQMTYDNQIYLVWWLKNNTIHSSTIRNRLYQGDQLEMIIGDYDHCPLGYTPSALYRIGDFKWFMYGTYEFDISDPDNRYKHLYGDLVWTGPYKPVGENRIVCGHFLHLIFLVKSPRIHPKKY